MGRSYKDIKYDLWYNLEKLGISPGRIFYALKGNSGHKQFSYSAIPNVSISSDEVTHKRGETLFGRAGIIDTGKNFSSLGTKYSLVLDAKRISVTPKFFVGQYGAAYECGFYINGNMSLSYYFATGAGIALTSTTDFDPGVLAITADGATSKSYVGGAFVSSVANSRSIGTGYNWRLGGGWQTDAGYPFILLRGFIAIKGALSASQVAAMTDLPALWKPRPDISYFETAGDVILPIRFNSKQRIMHTNIRM